MNNKTFASKNENGQASLVFIASLVIIMACFALLVDGGRYLVMRNRARMMADASALSGASALDIQKAGEGNFVLQSGGDGVPGSARYVATKIFNDNNGESPGWADYTLDSVRVNGNQIWVTITGRSTPVFGSNWGINYSTTITASARAAVGISTER
jgi:uncharacterized membrane protein